MNPTRAQRDAARTARRSTDDRPPAPWGTFPLTEVIVFLALVLCIAGLVVWGTRGKTMLAAGAMLGSVAGLELSIREHFAGYRSHTTLLSASLAVISMVISYLVVGGGSSGRNVLLAVGTMVFLIAFWLLREAFKRRSGGLGFR